MICMHFKAVNSKLALKPQAGNEVDSLDKYEHEHTVTAISVVEREIHMYMALFVVKTSVKTPF